MNVWQVAEYSLVVTVVALLLLVMKRLFHDKLDARWHYFIWMVLAVRMIVPLRIEWLKSPLSLFEAVPINYWTRLWELQISRAGLAQAAQAILPWYLAGVVILGSYYFVIAVIVRSRTIRLPKADTVICDEVAGIACKYGLKSCRQIKIAQNGSNYICGLIRPVLVLSVEEAMSEGSREQIILHELLHKKHGDVLINYALHLARALNWFNPFIWYVTAVILNDSEALCDQRVLELMREGGNEKTYGELLLGMAQRKGMHNARIGTTNMANSYRSMHTRIKRIADFRRVPSGVGFVALCITIILSVSSIGYCEDKNIVSSNVEDEADLNRVLLRAQLYDAETAQEAIYLYLKAMKNKNPVYLMSVMPQEDLREYEDWIYTMFRQDRFVRYYEGAIVSPEWINYKTEIVKNPWFVLDGSRMKSCTIYSLKSDEREGTAVAALSIDDEGNDAVIWWELALLYEDGWKVRRVSEHVGEDAYEPEPMVAVQEGSGDWLIEITGQNEASFPSVYQSNTGFQFYRNGQTAPTEETIEYPKQFESVYKMRNLYVTYLGDEPLYDTTVEVAVRAFTEEEYEKMKEEGLSLEKLTKEKQSIEQLIEQGLLKENASWQELARLAGVPEHVISEETSIKELNSISSSDGTAYKRFDGSKLVSGQKRQLSGSGSNVDSWKETDTLHFVAWIYYDGQCVEVIGK